MDATGDRNMREKALTIDGAELHLVFDDDADLLIMLAPASNILFPPFAENWLCEPLRILFGQPIYPRFVLRQSTKQSMNWVRPSPVWPRQSKASALWQGPKQLSDRDGFWESYRRLLSYITCGHDPKGVPIWEANRRIQFYIEVIQVACGSRWVCWGQVQSHFDVRTDRTWR